MITTLTCWVMKRHEQALETAAMSDALRPDSVHMEKIVAGGVNP